MSCTSCGQPRTPLFRGFCHECAPDLHAKYEAVQTAVTVAMRAYESETGKTAMGSWYAYEAWLERRLEGVALAKALLELYPDAARPA